MRKPFISALENHLVGPVIKILGGDFNYVDNLDLDKAGGNLEVGNSGKNEMNSIMSDFMLVEVFRALYPRQHLYTWSRGTVFCRLDRFYVSKSLKLSTESVEIKPVAFSGHIRSRVLAMQYFSPRR